MKKFFILFFLSMLLFSCDTEECANTSANEITSQIISKVRVYDQHDNFLVHYPVSISYQKWWCDGSYAIWVEYQGYLDDSGIFEAASPPYSLFNTEDYILVRFTCGSDEDKQTATEKISYNEFGSYTLTEHNFQITV